MGADQQDENKRKEYWRMGIDLLNNNRESFQNYLNPPQPTYQPQEETESKNKTNPYLTLGGPIGIIPYIYQKYLK